jgi:hypothetical protein
MDADADLRAAYDRAGRDLPEDLRAPARRDDADRAREVAKKGVGFPGIALGKARGDGRMQPCPFRPEPFRGRTFSMSSRPAFRGALRAAAALSVLLAPLLPAPALAGPAEDAAVARIIDEGMNRSAVMTTASQLMDGIGPRLTNSENHRKAERWAMDVLRGYGLANIHAEPFNFGLGWNADGWSAAMVRPPARADGNSGGVVAADHGRGARAGDRRADEPGRALRRMEGQARRPHRARLAAGRDQRSKDPVFKRYSDAEIGEFDKFDQPRFDPEAAALQIRNRSFLRKLTEFLKAEGALALVRMSYRDGKLVHGEGYDFVPGKTLAVPAMELAQEDYRRLVRLAKTGAAPEIELNIEARFDDKNLMAENVIAEIPGTDPKAGYVMAGAHFDSWIAGDGANDNGAGSVAVIEAARLIAKLGVRPKRTIRFALWSGEEQGLLGSRAYIEQHLASRPVDPALTGIESYVAWRNAFPITPKAEYTALKAYFNMDNGSGRFRGIYAEGNLGAGAILGDWLAPFKAMGAGRVVAEKTGGTDHVYLQSIGLPGYQFIQDPLDYDSRVHHSSIDTLDHMRADDMRQASVILAGMLWQAANSDKELPRSPLPTQPAPTDPFKVADPNQ